MIEPAIRSILVNDADVAGLVGQHVFHHHRPQGSSNPSIVLSTLSDIPEYTFDGPAGYRRGTMQMDLYADTYKEVKQLQGKAETALESFSGPVLDTRIAWLEIDDVTDADPLTQDGRPTPTEYSVSVDVRFMEITEPEF